MTGHVVVSVTPDPISGDGTGDGSNEVVRKLDFDQGSVSSIESGNHSVAQSAVDHGSIGRREDPASNLEPKLIGQMDEMYSCMLSLVSSVKNTGSVVLGADRVSASGDLPLILKRVVEMCQSHGDGDVMTSSMIGLASFITVATDSSKLCDVISTELSLWLNSLVRLKDYTPYVYSNSVKSVLALTETLLTSHYPHIADEGLLAIYSRLPVIYMGKDDASLYSQTLLSKFRFPRAVIRTVPYSFTSPNSKTLDIKSLDRLVADDMACGKLPLLVITTVGTEVTGHIDNIPAIKHICDTHGIWLHAKGSCSTLLTMSTPPPTTAVFTDCDSVTVSNLSSLPHAVLFINDESDVMKHQPKLVTSLPLWISLQEQGLGAIRERVSKCYDAATKLYLSLKEIPNIQLLEYPLTGHVICFRYYSQLDNLPGLSDPGPMDKLMSRLTALLYSEVEKVVGKRKCTELINLPSECGISVIRIAPLQSSTTLSSLDIDSIVTMVTAQVQIFETTLSQREAFNKEVMSRQNFRLVSDPLYPSLGAFQYTPKYLQDEEACHTSEGVEELNEVNEKISDYITSPSCHLDTSSCHLDTSPTTNWGDVVRTRSLAQFSVIDVSLVSYVVDVASLLDTIAEVAPKFENNSKYMARVAEIIRRGIEQASEELQLESEQLDYEKGIIRQIPIFGSVFNWVSPLEEKRVGGRSFNLQSGEVMSTVGSIHSPQIQSGEQTTDTSDAKI